MKSHTRFWWLAFFPFLLIACLQHSPAQPDYPLLVVTPYPIPTMTLHKLATGLEKPIYVADSGDGTLYVVEQQGVVRRLNRGDGSATTYLDITDRVNTTANERGLLSVAFHPQFSQNGRFFVHYTAEAGALTVSEFLQRAGESSADSSTERILISAEHPNGNHNGGQLQFGPDNLLYIAFGDGGGSDGYRNGQPLNTLLGKILRIDVDHGLPYGIPASNPFVGRTDARPEIWAYGLRNPWRFSFDRLTGDLFIGDVGSSQWEEINLQRSNEGGANFGWPLWEGETCREQDGCPSTPTLFPILRYDHDEGCAVTGGYRYRGTALPWLFGRYLYADFCRGTIWAAHERNGFWNRLVILETEEAISSFGESAEGELFLVTHQGNVYQIK